MEPSPTILHAILRQAQQRGDGPNADTTRIACMRVHRLPDERVRQAGGHANAYLTVAHAIPSACGLPQPLVFRLTSYSGLRVPL